MIQQAYKYVIGNLRLWPCLTFFFSELKITYSEIKWVGTEIEQVAVGTKCFIAVGVFSVELLAYQVLMVQVILNEPGYGLQMFEAD